MINNRSYILKTNRALGSFLLEKELITMTDLEEANNRLLENIQKGDLLKCNLISILVFEMGKLEESTWDALVIDTKKVGLIKLSSINIDSQVALQVDQSLCWSSLTVPFDRSGNITMVASTMLLFDNVKSSFEEKLESKIIWYYASLADMVGALERSFKE